MTSVKAETKPASSRQITPMMEQYIEIKTANPDNLLFYRMGDFYELFFEDAGVASRALGITLTKRGKHLGEDIPMCGVPIHAADEYLQKLIALGHRVAVCEQTEDPVEARKRGSKSVVRRDVVRLVTPGTLTEDRLLEAGANNYLAAVSRLRTGEGSGTFGIAWIDISTGVFRVTEADGINLPAELARIDASEVVIPDVLDDDPDLKTVWRNLRGAVVPVARALFDGATAADRLASFYKVATLDGFGTFTRAELCAASAVVAYVEKTQLDQRPPLDTPVRDHIGRAMLIDPATRANLELVRTLSGEKTGSLLSVIDRTVTGGGSRLLADRLAAPLTDPDEIARRHDSLAYLHEDTLLRERLRSALRAAPDMPRALSRIALDRAGPRDLAAVRHGLEAAFEIADLLKNCPSKPPSELASALNALAASPRDLMETLAAALDDELPLLKRDGGFVRKGYMGELDELRRLRDESREVIAGLQADYAEATSVRVLKIKYNNVLGWFIEVPTAHAEKLTSDPGTFIHRQTMAGAMRFTTTQLSDLETKIANAGERSLAIELEIFADLAASIVATGDAVKAAAEALAILDVTAALAVLAEAEGYARPTVDDSLAFDIEGGRHPVVEQAIRRDTGEPFVVNDCDLGPEAGKGNGRIWLVTGPNMAGKSTFLRQNALIAVLAQMGSYVPAAAFAHIGVVDRLFSRVGAADDLARGRSTFMVEMVETAAILNQAGERSLVILDEIGRGTATFDGLSIAWAAIEHLHEINRARSLFATHYHELTALSQRLDRLENATVKVKEWKGDVVFLHEIVPGAADRSYGIQVAKLAGLPGSVVERARAVLAQLEEQDRRAPAEALIDDLPLFAAQNPRPQVAASLHDGALAELLDTFDPDDMTPRQAHEALYKLKAKRAETKP
ncbi:DNA mismatch repair protein MutS [Breoghania sp.]|uniref:DNA mismatch repair protein MutS n=1 Tax=Breoghania sp. TaxID=2065378 RepID=UPI002613B10C|nr:DNA mismatch repair protein MutS [Breoghania sp.]MDJ0930400.1 DNA mismatch repair protein MutS [Breoghania sp.]